MPATIPLYDLVKSQINSLSKSELADLRELVRVPAPSKCETEGHNYKVGGQELYWVAPPKTVLFCIRCGNKKLI